MRSQVRSGSSADSIGNAAGERPLTLRVLGHQVVRTPEAYGLLLRTQELGEVVFSLPPTILKMLIADLINLAFSRPALPAQDVMHARGQPSFGRLRPDGAKQSRPKEQQ
jgi:hypothetical protein